MSTLEWNLVLLEKACVLVTLAFLLTRTRFLPSLLKPRLQIRDQTVVALMFLVIGLAEVAFTIQSRTPADPSMNLRIVAVTTAGLLGGSYVGIFVGIAVTVMAVYAPGHPGLPLPITISMVMGGFAAGAFHDWKPNLAVRPATGLIAGGLISSYRDVLNFMLDHTKTTTFAAGAGSSILHGVAVGLILLVIEQSRAQEANARSAAMAEVRALQARMDPHFLFNSLNTLSALSELDPGAVSNAVADLGKFLRASIDQHELPYISLEQELGVIDAFLAIEGLRLGDRLCVEKEIDSRLLNASIPPFLLQPLVENAVHHGLRPLTEGGRIRIIVEESDGELVVAVCDNGVGMEPGNLEQAFTPRNGNLHALTLVKRRLEALYGSAFKLTITSKPGEGCQVSVRIPYTLAEVQRDRPPLDGRGVLLPQEGLG